MLLPFNNVKNEYLKSKLKIILYKLHVYNNFQLLQEAKKILNTLVIFYKIFHIEVQALSVITRGHVKEGQKTQRVDYFLSVKLMMLEKNRTLRCSIEN